MNIPNMPTNLFLSPPKNSGIGASFSNTSFSQEMHTHWKIFFNQLVKELQTNLSNEGFVVPTQNQDNINSLNTPKAISKIIYNSDSSKMSVNNNGSFKPIAIENEELTTAQINAIPASQINGKWVYNTDTDKLYLGIKGIFREVNLT